MFTLLMLPLAYACIVGTILRDWQHAHPVIAYGIFFFLCALPVLYAIRGIYRFIRSIVG